MTGNTTSLVSGPQSAGWGVDDDPRNDPTYPMRNLSLEDRGSPNWSRPFQQPTAVEVLKSTEHRHLPAVFGTAAPPSGLSGVIRRRAFTRSESKWTHWLMLLFADRLNVIEGLVDDIRRGHVPNILGEMGIRSELRHNKRGLFRKVTTTVVVLAVLGILIWILVS